PRRGGNTFCFQIDGNFGGAAGIAEMLLQSHAGEVHILPALPREWTRGYVRGLRAREGFEVDIEWDGGALQRVTIYSRGQSVCRVRTPVAIRVWTSEGREVSVNRPEECVAEFVAGA